ncbi:hypothetical protein ACWD04_15695 [Streptomyces sp. NPDC002911]
MERAILDAVVEPLATGETLDGLHRRPPPPDAPLPEDIAVRIIRMFLQGLAPLSLDAQVTAAEPTAAPV